MIRARLQIRGQDHHGAGYFGAPRKNKSHRGIDYAALPGTVILSPVPGSVTKLGYPYGDDLSFRYVQVTDAIGRDHRFFYLDPLVRINDVVVVDTELGTVQDLVSRYPGITPHCHYEIKIGDQYINPEGMT